MERRAATPQEARALANPIRLRIIRLCRERSLTNKELAIRLGRDPGTILHHVRMLVAAGFLAPDPERRGARGATERPYRSTGKSWTLDVGDDAPGMLAMLDAVREELGEGTARDIRTMSRLAVRLSPQGAERFDARLSALVEELAAADEPDGEAFGFFVVLHRTREDRPSD
jgi:predicted ArsR family transcriptional regulator